MTKLEFYVQQKKYKIDNFKSFDAKKVKKLLTKIEAEKN